MKYKSKHMIDILFVLALFTLFTLSTVVLIIFGANIYQTTVNHMNSNFNARTSVSYITEKIRQADEYDNISVGSIQGIPCLELVESIDDITYCTYIYAYQDQLFELFSRTDIEILPENGQSIIPISSFSVVQVEQNLFHIEIINISNEKYSFYVSSHSHEMNSK